MIFPDNYFAGHWACGVACAAFLLAATPAMADIGEIGKPGAEPVPIRELKADKRVKDQVEQVLHERAAANRARASKARAAEKAAADKDAEERANGVNSKDLTVAPEEKAAAKADMAAATQAAPAVPPSAPALVIIFNRNHVDFERDLRHLLESSERSKVIARYDVVSEVPLSLEGGRRNERVSSEYEANLNEVINKFSALGVQASRINVVTRPSANITSQTISIFQN